MTSAPGVVVIDATFLKHLKNPDSVSRIEAATRAAHLELAPSVANVLEALKHSNAEIRRELLEAIRRWTANRPLNPWPLDLLRLAGEALPAIEFSIGPDEIDRLINRPEELDADHQKAVEFLTGLQAKFAGAYAASRPDFQKTLKAAGLKFAWPDIGAFLVSTEWSARSSQEHLVGVLWELAKLAGSPPSVDVVSRSEVWRLALDSFGAATYIQSVKPNKQANPPGFVDLLQLLYLSQHRRSRIFITDDNSLHETANQILRGRYENVRVMRSAEFLGLA